MYQLATSRKCLLPRHAFTVAHEVEAIVIVSQPDENCSKADGIQLEPAHNGKISMRSPSSNVIIAAITMTLNWLHVNLL